MANSYDVTIVGCGLMGAALARALAGSGCSVAAWNRTHERAEALAGHGVTPLRSIEDAVASTRLVIACASSYETTQSALEPVDSWQGTALVNLTSGAPDEAETMERWCSERGAGYLDGDVSAYPEEIGAPGTLLLFSGSPAVWREHEQTLMRLGGASRYLSDQVRAANALFQGICAFYIPALGAYVEAVTYVQSEGISPQLMWELTPHSLAMLRHHTEEAAFAIASGIHAETDQAKLEVFAEGSRAALKAMQQAGHQARLFAAAVENMNAAEAAGLGKLDFYAQTKVARIA